MTTITALAALVIPIWLKSQTARAPYPPYANSGHAVMADMCMQTGIVCALITPFVVGDPSSGCALLLAMFRDQHCLTVRDQ